MPGKNEDTDTRHQAQLRLTARSLANSELLAGIGLVRGALRREAKRSRRSVEVEMVCPQCKGLGEGTVYIRGDGGFSTPEDEPCPAC